MKPANTVKEPPVEVQADVVSQVEEDKNRTVEVPAEEKLVDTDVKDKLHRILSGKPLEAYIDVIILEANKQGFDPAWTAAISIVESSGGLHNFRAYNAWGWYGGKNFTNWEDSISQWSAYFNRVYISKGLTTPKTVQPKYCPPNASWATKVQGLMNK